MADATLRFDTNLQTGGLESGLRNIGGLASTAFKAVTVGAAAATTAFAALSIKALQLGGDLEQSLGGIETLFKGNADTVIKNAEKAYLTAGVNANAYMQQVTSFSASLLQSLGGDTEAAAKVADMAIIDMADNANKMGSSIESIQNAYQGFAKQNYMMLDNLKLGYGGTKTEMERLLADAEKLSGVKYDISNLNDVYQAIHIIQEELGIVGTTAKEGMETLTGSFTTAKAAMSNFLSGAGDVDSVVSSVSNLSDVVAKNLDVMLPRLTTGMTAIFEQLAPKIPAMISKLAPAFVDGGVILIKGLVKGIMDNLPMLLDAGKQIASTLIKGIGDISPILRPVTAALDLLINNIETITAVLLPAISAFVAFKAAVAIQSILTGLIVGFQTAALQVTLYAMSVGGAITAEALHAGALTAKQVIVGLLTGQVTLAAAAQWLWNAAMSANPIGIIVAGAAALATALVILATRTSETTKKYQEQAKELTNLTETYNNNKKSIQDNMNAEIAKADSIAILRDKLFELDKQIKSGTLTEEESIKAKNELKVVADELTKAVPGLVIEFNAETGALKTQEGQIIATTDAYINMMKAKALSTAYSKGIDESTEAAARLKKELAEMADAPEKFGWGGRIVVNGIEVNITKEYQAWENLKNQREAALAQAQADLDYYAGEAGKIWDESNGRTAQIVADGNEAISKENKEAFDEREKLLKRNLDRQEITELQYYQGLGRARNEYLAKGSESWEESMTDEIKFKNKMDDERIKEEERLAKEQAQIRKESAKEQERLQKEAVKAQEQAERDKFNFSKKWIEEEKYYNRLSLADELAAWERVQARYAEGSEQRKEADREVYRVKKEAAKEAYDKEKELIKATQGNLKEFKTKSIEIQNETSKEKIEIISDEYLERIQWVKDENSVIDDAVHEQMSLEFDRNRERLQNLRDEKSEIIETLALTNEGLYNQLKGIQDQKDAISDRQRAERDAEKTQGFADKRSQIYDKMATATAEEQIKLQEDLNSLEKDEAAWNKELADRAEINRLSEQEKQIRSEISENNKKAKEAAEEYNKEVKETVDLLSKAMEVGQSGGISVPISLEWLDEDLDKLAKLGFDTNLANSEATEETEPIVKAVKSSVSDNAENLQASGKEITENVGKGVTDNISLINEPASGIIDTAIQAMKEKFTEISPFANSLYAELRSKLDEQPWNSLGYNMIMGVTKGIYSALQPLIDSVLYNIRAALAAGRSELGIASPAKETISDGMNWVLGYIKGIKNTEPQLLSTVRGLSADMLSMPLGSHTPMVGVSAADGGGTTQYITVQVQSMRYDKMNEYIDFLSESMARRGY